MQNAESNDWEDESASASREEMLERQRVALSRKKKQASLKIVANDVPRRPMSALAKRSATSDTSTTATTLTRQLTVSSVDTPPSPYGKKPLLFDDDTPDEPLPAEDVKPMSAFALKLREQGIEDVYEPSDKRFLVSPTATPAAGASASALAAPAAPQPTKDPRAAALFFENLEEFVNSPAPEGIKVQCIILRQKVGADSVYTLKLERPEEGRGVQQVFLLAGRKRKMGASANYAISTNESEFSKEADSFLAKLRSNFVGTHFTVFDNGVNPSKQDDTSQPIRKELAAVIYELNPLGFKGPRKMTVLIPAIDEATHAPHQFSPVSESEGLLGRHKTGNTTKMMEYINKAPVWNETTQSFVLNFYGRVTMASVKNFQIINANDPNYIVLQFGRVAENMFTMDFQYPMSALQAFGVVLSSFDGKLACE